MILVTTKASTAASTAVMADRSDRETSEPSWQSPLRLKPVPPIEGVGACGEYPAAEIRTSARRYRACRRVSRRPRARLEAWKSAWVLFPVTRPAVLTVLPSTDPRHRRPGMYF